MAREWDLKSTHSLEAAAEWLRRKADALIVVVVRAEDGVIAADELIDVMDVHDRLWDASMPKLLARLRAIRDEKRAKLLKKETKG